MTLIVLIVTLILALAPISELRGAIPFAYFNGTPLWLSVLLGTGANLLVSPLAYLFLTYLHTFFYSNWLFYKRFFNKSVSVIRHKLEKRVEKHGVWAITLFVGIPLPITGAWTGTLGAWVFGLSKKKTVLAVSLGVVISSLIITTILLLGIGINSIFIKSI